MKTAVKHFGVVASTNSAIEWVNINTVSPDIIQEYFCGAETAFMFMGAARFCEV